MADKDAALAALERGDEALAAALYFQRAQEMNDPQARCFYATHAYVHALSAGDTNLIEAASNLLRQAGRLR